MGALTDIRAGPTEEQRRHREDQRAQLQRDLDEQIRQKREKEARVRADDERARLKEEGEHRAYVERLRVQHEAEERARRGGEEEEGEGEGEDQGSHSMQQQYNHHYPQQQQQQQGYTSHSQQPYPQQQQQGYPPQPFPQQQQQPSQKNPRQGGPASYQAPPPAAAPVIKKAGGPFGSVAVDDSGGHIVARKKNKKVIEADWLDGGKDMHQAYEPPPPRPPSPPTKAAATKPAVIKAGGPFGSVAVDDSGGHVLAKNKNRNKRIIEADWLDVIPAGSSHISSHQEPVNPLAAIVRRSTESHPFAPNPVPSISPRGNNPNPNQSQKRDQSARGSKERTSVGASGGSIKGDVAAMLLELQKEQLRLRDEFKRHSEAMQRIVQGAGDVASSRDKAWQDLDRIRSRLSANVGEVAALGASVRSGGGGLVDSSNGEFRVISTHLLPREANAIPSRLTTPIEAQWIQDEINEIQGQGEASEGLYGIGEEGEGEGDILRFKFNARTQLSTCCS